MKILQCDWCKKEVKEQYTSEKLINFTWGYNSILTGKSKERNQIDVCYSCSNAFINKLEINN